jgi:hypothetical protein
VHSSEENKDEVVIRPKNGIQKVVKTPAVIQEEPYGRITNNHKMSSFCVNGGTSNTLPHNRSIANGNAVIDQASIIDYSQCNTMPLMPSASAHQHHRMSVNDSPKQRTTLPSNIRYSSGVNYLRQMPQMKNAESPYAATGLGSGHHSFSQKLIQNEPLPAPPTLQYQQQNIPMTQSQSQQQQFTMLPSINHNQNPVHHYNAPPSSSSSSTTFTGMNHHSNPYQMVVNELCASNHHQTAAAFPPPPPPINTIPMHH